MIWSPSECLAGAITTYTWRVDTFCLRHGDSSSHGNKPPSPPPSHASKMCEEDWKVLCKNNFLLT